MKKTFMMPVVCSLLAASMMLSGCSAVSNGDNAGGDIEANGDQEHWPDGAGYVQSVLLCHG